MHEVKQAAAVCPQRIRQALSMLPASQLSRIEELRLRCGQKPTCLKNGREQSFADFLLRTSDLDEVIDRASENSAYAVQDMLKNGYLTICGGHRIGGYPCFEQDDPRDVTEELRKYDTLLLQIVSHTMPDTSGNEETLIMFGDEGGCQFFIPREKLRARDFSDVMYNWDCC